MNYCNELLAKRANTTTYWMYEKEEYQYTENVKQGLKPYLGPTDIEYTFNSYGFRCDEFDLESELPIVFLGCSNTEGLGLPLKDMWSYQLIKSLREFTGLTIPYWNLAFTGSGVDTQARFLYEFCKTKPVKYVFALLPQLSRREYAFDSPDIKIWNPSILAKSPIINKIFVDDSFAYHETSRSLMIIDSICRAKDAKFISSTWAYDDPNLGLLKDFPSFNHFNVYVNNIDVARDLVHYGPMYNRALSIKMLSIIKPMLLK